VATSVPSGIPDALQARRWQTVLDSARDAIISIDADGRISLFNRAAETMFGWRAAEILGQNVALLMPSPYQEQHDDFLRRYRETGEAKAIGRIRFVEAKRRSGAVFPIELSVSEARVADDVVYSAIIRDVSERVRLQSALGERLRQQESLAELGVAAVQDGSPTILDEAARRLADGLGTDVSGVFERLPAETTLRLRAGVGWPSGAIGSLEMTAADTGVDAAMTEAEAQAPHVPGALRDLGAVAALSVPVGNAEQPLGLLVVGSRQARVFEAHDVAFARTMAGLLAGALSLEQAGHALRRERDFASGLVETAPVIVTVLDPTGHIEWFNPHLEHLSGRCLEHCWGRDWFEVFIPPREHERARSRFARSLAGHSRRGTVEAMLTRDGHERLIQWHDTVLPDGGGGMRGVLAIGLDVTDRSRAEQDLQQRQRLADIGALVTRIVHDIANPLAGLSMLAQRVLRRVERAPTEPVRSVGDAARQMVETAHRLERLVGEFKDFAREQRLHLEALDVRRFLEETAAFWRLEAGARGIDLQVQSILEPLTLRGDADKLRRVLDNVIKNALEAVGEAPGRVRLGACRTDGNRLRLSVRDTGPGVPANVDPFSLFETSKPSGTGLGLPVSKQIVLAHGGGMTLAADRPLGTVCTIELPLDGPAV